MFRKIIQNTQRLLLVVVILLFATPAIAKVLLTEKVEYYSVSGTGKKEITSNLKKHSPHKKGKDYFPAYTQTDIKYEYSWGKKGNRCIVKKVTVRLTLTYVYPRLTSAQSSTVQKWWDDKIKRFVVHENIHGDISKRSAYELDRKLRGLKDLNCKSAKSVIGARAKYIIRQMKKEQKEYDRITQHGIKQHKYRPPR